MPTRRHTRGRGAAGIWAGVLAVFILGCGSSEKPNTPSVSRAVAAARSPADPPAKQAADPPARTAAAGTPGPPKGIPPAHPVPAAFRPAPGAPSDAEVRSELEQMAAVQREERRQALSAAAADLAGLLPWSMEPRSGTQVSVASVFTDYGLGLACGGVLGRSQLGVAHKTAPCGTLITFTYGGRSLTVPVIDRGPYIAGREWDLTGATAAALGFPGLGPIQWSVAG